MTNMRFAEEMGAQTRVLTGFDIVNEIMTFAREQNVTIIMIWKHIRNRWYNLFFRSLPDEIVRHSREIDVYIMTGTTDDYPSEKPIKREGIPWIAYGWTIAFLAVVTIINFFLSPYLSINNLIMVYLFAVTLISLMGEMGPSIFASLASVLLCAYFFIPPPYTFKVSDKHYIFTLGILVIVSQIISQLTIRMRRQTVAARFAENEVSSLYKLSSQLATNRGFDTLLGIGISYIGTIFHSQVLALIPVDSQLMIRATYRSNTQSLDDKEMSVAQWSFELGQKAGFGTNTLSFSNAMYLPLVGSKGVLGVIRIQPDQPESFLKTEQMHLLEACVSQIALALALDVEGEKNIK
jgi:two-component system sensor histidine kinase KdpD